MNSSARARPGRIPATRVIAFLELSGLTPSVVGAFSECGVRAGAEPRGMGMVSGMFFGLAFGTAEMRFGTLADSTGIDAVYRICAFLPAIGLLTAFLPNIEPGKSRQKPTLAD